MFLLLGIGCMVSVKRGAVVVSPPLPPDETQSESTDSQVAFAKAGGALAVAGGEPSWGTTAPVVAVAKTGVAEAGG